MNKDVQKNKGIKAALVIAIVTGIIVTAYLIISPTGRLVFHSVGYNLFPDAYITRELITSGSYKNISIGKTRNDAIVLIKAEYPTDIYINESYLQGESSGMLVPLTFSQEQIQLLQSNDKYKIFLSRSFSDWLEFTFDQNGRLKTIERYERTLEIP